MTAKSSPKASKPKPADVELEPDAWNRFESAVGRVVKVPPQPHKAPAAPSKKGALKRQ